MKIFNGMIQWINPAENLLNKLIYLTDVDALHDWQRSADCRKIVGNVGSSGNPVWPRPWL